MNREQIKQHWAAVVNAVFRAEDAVQPTLKERVEALGDNPTKEQKDTLVRQYCLDIAEELLAREREIKYERNVIIKAMSEIPKFLKSNYGTE